MKSKTNTEDTKRNFIRGNRRWEVIRKHAPLVLKPFFVALGFTCLWFLCHLGKIYFPNKSTDRITLILIPLSSLAYVFFGTIAVSSVFSDYKKISRCVVKHDVDEFLLYRDEQLPIKMHILVGTPSVFLVMSVMFLYYHDILTGLVVNFCVVYTLTLVWSIVTDLDDVERSVWFKKKIPKEWLEIDIERYFQSKREKAFH